MGDLVETLQYLPEEEQIKMWDLVDAWIDREDDDQRRASLRERIRRFAFTGRAKRCKLGNETRDRALKAYSLLVPRDLVLRHQWLFAKMWVDQSTEEFEDENFEYHKREDKIRRLRIDALNEIWTARKFAGIISLLKISGAASPIGWHMPIFFSRRAVCMSRTYRVMSSVLIGKTRAAERDFSVDLLCA